MFENFAVNSTARDGAPNGTQYTVGFGPRLDPLPIVCVSSAHRAIRHDTK